MKASEGEPFIVETTMPVWHQAAVCAWHTLGWEFLMPKPTLLRIPPSAWRLPLPLGKGGFKERECIFRIELKVESGPAGEFDNGEWRIENYLRGEFS